MTRLTARELQRMRENQEDFELINVLSQDDFNAAHIPGSDNIPHNEQEFVRQVERAAGSKDRKIVVYCGSRECDASPRAANKLEAAGFTNVYDFEGGVKEWKEANLPLEGSRA